MLRSDDRGRAFRRITLPYKGSLFTAELPSADGREMIVAGLRGNVWRSTETGENGVRSTLAMPVSITALAMLPGDAGELAPAIVFVAQAGQTRCSRMTR